MICCTVAQIHEAFIKVSFLTKPQIFNKISLQTLCKLYETFMMDTITTSFIAVLFVGSHLPGYTRVRERRCPKMLTNCRSL